MADADKTQSRAGASDSTLYYGKERRRLGSRGLLSPHLIEMARDPAGLVQDANSEQYISFNARGSMLPLAVAVVVFWGGLGVLVFWVIALAVGPK